MMLSPSERVLKRIAEAEETEPSELEESLYEVVDADALNALFESFEEGPTRDEGEAQFQYHGYEVVVPADGEVTIRDLD